MTSKRKDKSEITIVPLEKLINDLKLLLIGIESETFKRSDETLTFHPAKRDIVCVGVSELSNTFQHFIEAGTCFKRLKTFTSKNPFNQNQIFDGLIFKAFCDRIVKFLNYCRDLIYSQDVHSILELVHNTLRIREIVIHISKFLNIHPSSSITKMTIPNGSDFLKFLYNEYINILHDDVKLFYIDLLKSCCQVYFLRYQEWIYHGKLEDPYKELFIYFVDHYNPNTKYFFDKAFSIRKQSVPTFLDLCADNILLCGKYTMLLKSQNPMHPLLFVKKPHMKICITYDQVNDLRNECDDFIKHARKACGAFMTIEGVLNERKSIRLEKLKNAERASVLNVQKWREEQKQRTQEIREYREMQQKELCRELQLIEDKKMMRRLEDVLYEKQMMDEVGDLEYEKDLIENDRLRERIKAYETLNREVDKDNENCLRLKDKLQSKADLKPEDLINANNPSFDETTVNRVKKDDMNNIIIEKSSLTDAQKNKIKIMSHEFNIITSSSSSITYTSITDETREIKLNNSTLTDAQKNKLKVLGSEFDLMEDKNLETPSIKVQDFEKMTELQKNKLKVMSHEFGMKELVENQTIKATSLTNELTDLQKNRIKVLSHEFGYDTSYNISAKNSAQKSLSLDFLKPNDAKVSQDVVTSPMSVTSDHFNSDGNDSDDRVLLMDESINQHVNKGGNGDDEDEDLVMIKAFEEAVEKNRMNFLGIGLSDSYDDYSSSSGLLIDKENFQDVSKMDTVSLAQFLQMSLTLPLNAYMDVLNNETLKMYVLDLKILSHFKSMRNYFLLMNGEFSSVICHELFSKLDQTLPNELLNYQSLHTILNHALNGSQQFDVNIENLSFIVQNIPEKFELYSPNALNMLTLSYKIEWPLSLILNPETILQYQTIFNYLLKLKRITWVLEECFQMLKESHKRHGSSILNSQQYRNAQYTRHKMAHFVQCLENYVTRNVLQMSWHAFINDLKSAQSILCIYRKHTNYLKRILFLCLLNKKSFEFFKIIEDIFKVILKFHK
jgi:gamma-tubulin complex component 6